MAMTIGQIRDLARRAHDRQVDKLGVPYFQHVEAVANALAPIDIRLEAAGWLHDILEDTPWTAQHLREVGVSTYTVSIVEAVTKRPGESYEDRTRIIAENPQAALVKIADNAHNSHPERMAQLPEWVRARLEEKYQRAREVLWPVVNPIERNTVLTIVNPALLDERH